MAFLDFLKDDKGFFQRGKSFGGRGLGEILSALFQRNAQSGGMPNAPTAAGFSPMMSVDEYERKFGKIEKDKQKPYLERFQEIQLPGQGLPMYTTPQAMALLREQGYMQPLGGGM